MPKMEISPETKQMLDGNEPDDSAAPIDASGVESGNASNDTPDGVESALHDAMTNDAAESLNASMLSSAPKSKPKKAPSKKAPVKKVAAKKAPAKKVAAKKAPAKRAPIAKDVAAPEKAQPEKPFGTDFVESIEPKATLQNRELFPMTDAERAAAASATPVGNVRRKYKQRESKTLNGSSADEQKNIVLLHLEQRGQIDEITASVLYGIMSLQRVIHDLRNDGHPVFSGKKSLPSVLAHENILQPTSHEIAVGMANHKIKVFVLAPEPQSAQAIEHAAE